MRGGIRTFCCMLLLAVASGRILSTAATLSRGSTVQSQTSSSCHASHPDASPSTSNLQSQSLEEQTDKAPHTLREVEARFRAQCSGLDQLVQPAELAAKVYSSLPRKVSTEQLTELMAETAASQASMHPDFARLAARVTVAKPARNHRS